jgi:hypothetical protein
MLVEEKYKVKFNDSIDRFITNIEQTFNSTNAQQAVWQYGGASILSAFCSPFDCSSG